LAADFFVFDRYKFDVKMLFNAGVRSIGAIMELSAYFPGAKVGNAYFDVSLKLRYLFLGVN
jgi:hypothetical protein